ncbi:MAG: GNAT family N-acetyltransferase [Candidatus Helarchaeota archaeon]
MAKIETQIAPSFNIKEYATIRDYEIEAEAVAHLYQKTYEVTTDNYLTQLQYPYPEVFDPAWIHATASDENVIWKVVIDTLTNRVIGSGTIELDPAHQRGYVRGVMIDPDYQGYGLASYIMVNTYREIIDSYRDKVKLFWCESRTAHARSQKIAEASGMKPVGLLPNKDYFLNKRESDLLMVLYGMGTLKQRRPNPLLIPEVLPLFNHIGAQFRLTDAILTKVTVPSHNGFDIRANIYPDKYHYLHCTYQTAEYSLTFIVNPRTQAAEKLQVTPETPPVLFKKMLKFAIHSLSPALFYMECYTSAYLPEYQQVCADLGFRPTGYLPGWEVKAGEREDRIVWTWMQQPPSLTQLALTRKARKLAKIVLT